MHPSKKKSKRAWALKLAKPSSKPQKGGESWPSWFLKACEITSSQRKLRAQTDKLSKRCIHPKKKSRDDQVGTRVQQKNNVTAHGFFEKPCHHYLHRYILRRRITSVFNHSLKHKLFGLEDSLMAVEIWLVVVSFSLPPNHLIAQWPSPRSWMWQLKFPSTWTKFVHAIPFRKWKWFVVSCLVWWK